MQRGYQIFKTYHFIMSNIKYSYDKDNMSYFAKQVPNPKKILNMDAVIPFSTLATFTNNMYNISEDSIKNDSKKELSIKHTIDVINTSINKYDGSILKAQLLDKTIDNQSFDLYIDFSVKRRLDNDQTSGSNKKLKIENNEHTLRRSEHEEHEQDKIDKKENDILAKNIKEQDKIDKKENDILAKNIKEQDKIDKKENAILAKKIKEQDKIDKKEAAIFAKNIKEQDKIDKIQQKEDAKQAKILEREIAKQDKQDKIQQKQEEKRLKEKEKQDKKDEALLAKQIKEKEKQDKKDAAILANISKLQAKILS